MHTTRLAAGVEESQASKEAAATTLAICDTMFRLLCVGWPGMLAC